MSESPRHDSEDPVQQALYELRTFERVGAATSRAMIAEIERLRANSVARCEWIEDENGTWDTGCGNAFQITDGTPAENRFKFCAYCGGALVELQYRALEDE